MRTFNLTCIFCLIILFIACKHVPETYSDATDTLNVYPEYSEAYIPYNIAPLNFIITNKASFYLTTISSKNGKSLLIKGKEVRINLHDWKKLLESNKGEALCFDIYLKQGGRWYKYPTIKNHIAVEPIDGYIVYRWIQPLYTTYEDITINQRSLENFDVKRIYDSRLLTVERSGQCVNCHSFQDYNRQGNMQMHFRGESGGTVILSDNKQKKINTKVEGLVSGAVYPSWHPTQHLIAYSVNDIGQDFHTKDLQKTEVLDTRSDLILYDVDKNEITTIEAPRGKPRGISDSKKESCVLPANPAASSGECARGIQAGDGWLETFPYWSPDGNSLYFSVARYEQKYAFIDADIVNQHENIKYNIVRRPFNQANRLFGAVDTIVSASSIGKSATFPRVSPDGKYLLFSMGDFGNFHIWHKSSDLYLMNLETRTYKNLETVNSPDVESYHAWSSNGRWIIFSSRRDDGNYTRLYIAYFDKNGVAHKPFILPQKNPLFDRQLFKSYNIPEFIVEPVHTNRHKLLKTITGEAENARLVN